MNYCINKLKPFVSYLWSKKTELTDMDEKDGLLAKVVLDIHRKRTHSTFVIIPLAALYPIHPINRENSYKATKKRIEILSRNKETLLEAMALTIDVLSAYIPSVSGIKVVQVAEDRYVAYEGNGRLAALQEVFVPTDEMRVEVELYHFNNPTKIIRRINRVRRLHQLDQGAPVMQSPPLASAMERLP